jgi:hypothetical protein
MKKIITLLKNNIRNINYHNVRHSELNYIISYIKKNNLSYIVDSYKTNDNKYSIFIEKK